MIGSDYVLEAHNIYHTAEVINPHLLFCSALLYDCKPERKSNAISFMSPLNAGWQWRLFKCGRKHGARIERCEFNLAQRWGDGHIGFERQRQKGTARCHRMSCGKLNARPSAAEWINTDSINIPAEVWLCHTCGGLHLWSYRFANAALHTNGRKYFFHFEMYFGSISKSKIPFQFNGYSKGSKVRQILADLALSQVANKRVEYLNISEKRRLAIGVQLVRESVMVLLDEPTHGLDPLDAYLLVSILSNYAKKTGCGILLSMEKPRSDVFPFLDRALFLCLGGVVYSGSTRGMLEYFHSIGFPCPQLENPLMYYLCLSTVDRRQVEK